VQPGRSRVELPFAGRPHVGKHHKTVRANRTRVATAHQPVRWHVIKPGETLIKLARLYYQGVGAHWKGIFAVNKAQLRDPHRVFPGDRIAVPTLAEAIAAEHGGGPLLTAAPARVHVPSKRIARWRHKTRIAHREPILKARPGVPI